MTHNRTLHIRDTEWRYHIGKFAISIRGPEGQRIETSHSELTGIDEFYIDKDRWKGSAHAITPGMVKAHILEWLKDPVPPRVKLMEIQKLWCACGPRKCPKCGGNAGVVHRDNPGLKMVFVNCPHCGYPIDAKMAGVA